MNQLDPTEDVPKGRNDRPSEDVVIVDSGELPVEPASTSEEKEVPTHAEL